MTVDVEVVQLIDCNTHVGSFEQWQPDAPRQQHGTVKRVVRVAPLKEQAVK